MFESNGASAARIGASQPAITTPPIGVPPVVNLPLSVKVLSPNGGTLTPGQVVTIQWQSSGAASQSVKYTLDGATYIDIINDLPGTATSTQWTVPQASTTVARVRVAVRDAAGTRLTDDSDSPITIQPAAAPSILSVTPASGPVAGGNQVTISGNGFTQGCVVRFGGTDAQVIGVTPSQVIAIAPAQAVAGPVNIRLVNPDGQFVVASSAYTYVAVALTVRVLSPNGGERLQPGQAVTIQWQSSGAASQSVKYTLDGATYIDIVNDLPGTAASTQWVVPQANTSIARVRVAVRDAAGTRVTDDSDTPFTIQPISTAPTITLVTPSSGPASGGTTVTIIGQNFQAGCVVRFDGIDAQVLSVTPTQVVVRTPVANPGATAVNIRLVNPDGQFVVASGAYTYIATPLTVRVLSPNGGERLQPGQSVTIQWQSSGAASQSVKYTLDGATYIDIVNDLPGTATSTQWVVPQASTTTARVRVAVRDAAGTRVTDDSDTPFTIQSIVSQPAIAAVTPMSGPASGGTLVTIDGQGFRAGCSVRFGSLFGTVQSVTDTRITVKTPVSSPGLVDVRVTNADGGSATRAGGFRFTTTQMQASPQVRSIQVTDPDGIDPTEQFVTTANSGSVNAGKILVVELYYVTIPPDLNLSFNLFALGVPPGVQVGFSPNPMSYATIYSAASFLIVLPLNFIYIELVNSKARDLSAFGVNVARAHGLQEILCRKNILLALVYFVSLMVEMLYFQFSEYYRTASAAAACEFAAAPQAHAAGNAS